MRFAYDFCSWTIIVYIYIYMRAAPRRRVQTNTRPESSHGDEENHVNPQREGFDETPHISVHSTEPEVVGVGEQAAKHGDTSAVPIAQVQKEVVDQVSGGQLKDTRVSGFSYQQDIPMEIQIGDKVIGEGKLFFGRIEEEVEVVTGATGEGADKLVEIPTTFEDNGLDLSHVVGPGLNVTDGVDTVDQSGGFNSHAGNVLKFRTWKRRARNNEGQGQRLVGARTQGKRILEDTADVVGDGRKKKQNTGVVSETMPTSVEAVERPCRTQ